DNDNSINSQSAAVITVATQPAPATTPVATGTAPLAATSAPTAEHHHAAMYSSRAELPRQIANQAENVSADAAAMAINDPKAENTLNDTFQLLVMPTQQQAATARSESIMVQPLKSQAAPSQSAKSAEFRASIGDRDADSITGTGETSLQHSPIEMADNF